MTTSANRIEEIFRDARELQADALEMLTQGRIRNAAEKAWGATKRATDALILARTGEEPERTPETGAGLRTLSSLDEEVSRARLVRRYHSRQGILHGQCFYHGLCDPLEDTERRIRKTVDYIEDAQQLAGVHRSSAVPVGRQSQAKEPLDLVGDAEKALSEALLHRSQDEQKLLRGCLAVLLGVDIHRVVKNVGGRRPVYYLYTEQGDVTLGTIHLVTSWKRCTDRIAETLGVMASVDSARKRSPERHITRVSPGCHKGVLDAARSRGGVSRKDAGLAEGAAKLGWDRLASSPGFHRFTDHVHRAEG